MRTNARSTVKVKRTVDDIFDDLETIGQRRPSFLDENNDNMSQAPVDEMSPSNDGVSPPLKQCRSETPVVAQSSASRSGTRMNGSATGGLVGGTPIVIGSPTLSDLEQLSESPAFATELTTKHRKAEEAADLAVFLAESLNRCPSAQALIELTQHFIAQDSSRLLRTLRHSGLIKQFLNGALNDGKYGPHRSDTYRIAIVVFLHIMCEHIPHDAIPIEGLFHCLIFLLDPSVELNKVPRDSVPTQKPAGLAAVVGRKKTASVSVVDQSLDQGALEAVRRLACSVSSSPGRLSSSEETAGDAAVYQSGDLRCLSLALITKVLLDHNCHSASNQGLLVVRSLSNMLDKSAAATLVECGGVKALLQILQRISSQSNVEADDNVLHYLLSLLELCSCDGDAIPLLRNDVSTVQQVVAAVATVAASSTVRQDHLEGSLRVLINITSSIPQAIDNAAAGVGQQLCDMIYSAVVQKDNSSGANSLACDEVQTLCLCLAINLVKKGENVSIVRFLARIGINEASGRGESHFLRILADKMLQLHEGQESASNVMAGYFATLLACISLCPMPGHDCRVEVITAVTRALQSHNGSASPCASSLPVSSSQYSQPLTNDSQGSVSCFSTDSEGKIKRKPMIIVVAILQEFVMFQSAAGILTKEVLISMHDIIERLMQNNNITADAIDAGS